MFHWNAFLLENLWVGCNTVKLFLKSYPVSPVFLISFLFDVILCYKGCLDGLFGGELKFLNFFSITKTLMKILSYFYFKQHIFFLILSRISELKLNFLSMKTMEYWAKLQELFKFFLKDTQIFQEFVCVVVFEIQTFMALLLGHKPTVWHDTHKNLWLQLINKTKQIKFSTQRGKIE